MLAHGPGLQIYRRLWQMQIETLTRGHYKPILSSGHLYLSSLSLTKFVNPKQSSNTIITLRSPIKYK